jgi:hypothetical protein
MVPNDSSNLIESISMPCSHVEFVLFLHELLFHLCRYDDFFFNFFHCQSPYIDIEVNPEIYLHFVNFI